MFVGNQDFYLDLLFYHIHLRCFVVIELKAGRFKPEYAGKVGFYMTAVDEKLKKGEDNPTIGLILCKENNDKIVAEYTLKSSKSPLGVATYTTTLPENLKNQLPDIKMLEDTLREVKERKI